MNDKTPSEIIFELINSKNFDALNQEEKLFVLTEMDKNEYDHIYETQKHLKKTLNEKEFSPDENLKKTLLTEFEKHHESKVYNSGIFKFLYIKIPIYQPIAAAIISFVFLITLYYLNGYSNFNNERIVYKYLTDTLFVQPEISYTRDTLKNNVSNSEEIRTKEKKTSPSNIEKISTEKTIEASLCRSIKKDSNLKQFMVSL